MGVGACRAGPRQAGKAGVRESAESRDMEVALAIFVEASCAESRGGKRSRELDDRSSCHRTASTRDNSPHCTDGEAGEAIHRAASSLAQLFCLGKETTHAEMILR